MAATACWVRRTQVPVRSHLRTVGPPRCRTSTACARVVRTFMVRRCDPSDQDLRTRVIAFGPWSLPSVGPLRCTMCVSMFQRTDDLRITQVRPLLPPAILLEEIPLTERASNVVANSRRAIANVLNDGDSRLVVVVGPCSIHDTARGARLRAAPRAARPPLRGRAHRRHAHLLREAADVGRLEGAHQRPRSRRELSHQQGAASRPPAARGRERSRARDGIGVPRHADPAVHRRPDVVGGDWRADDGEPGAPGAGLGALDAGGVQEQHRRHDADGRRRGALGAVAAPVPVGHQAGRVGHLRDERQRHVPRDPARRQPHGPELRRRARAQGVRPARRARPARRS